MADDFPDLHHKFCKKLALLQTGFFHLNIKNDENDLIYQTIVESYEQEMDIVVQNANAIVEKYITDNPQFKEVHEIHAAYQAFKQNFEHERSESIMKFDNYKENIDSRVQEINENAQKEIDAYKAEVDSLKEKMLVLNKLVGNALSKDVQAEFDKEMEEKRMKQELEEKTHEMIEIKTKYFELEKEYRILEEAYKNEEWELENLRNRDLQNEKLILELRNTIAQDHLAIDSAGANVVSIEYGGSGQDMTVLSAQVKDLQKEMEDMKESEKVLKEKEEERMEEYENRLKEASKEHRKMIETLHKEYNENLAEQEEDFEKERKKWETMVQGMQITLESRNEYINGLEDKVASLETQIQKMNEDAKQREENLQQEISRLNTVLEDSRKLFENKLEAEKASVDETKKKLIEEVNQEKEASLKALKEELNQAKISAESAKDKKIKELESKLEEIGNGHTSSANQAEEYQNKINELSQRHNTNVRELLEKHEEKEKQVEKKYEKEIGDLKKELEREKQNILKSKEDAQTSEISKLKKDYEAKIQKLSKGFDQQLKEKIAEYEEKLKGKDVEVGSLRKDIDLVKEQLKVEARKLQEKESRVKDLEKTATLGLMTEAEETQRSTTAGELRGSLVYMDKDKEEIIKDHLKYSQKVDEVIATMRKQHEERVTILEQRYNDLMQAFEDRPSRPEDLDLIRRLQEDDSQKKMGSETIKTGTIRKEASYSKISISQPIFNANSAIHSVDKSRKVQKTMSPVPTTTVLPPIGISQFNIQVRSPPVGTGLLASKKFFK